MDRSHLPLSSLAPLPTLLSGYAGREVARHRLIWAYDARLADVVRTTREPMMGQMRLTWWHEVLSDEAALKGRGDPLVDAMRGDGDVMAAREALLRMIDGWEMLLDPLPLNTDTLRRFAEGRGGGLFKALDAEASVGQGALWALWDLSGHIGEGTTAQRAVALAREYLSAYATGGKAVRIASALARRDIVRGRAGPSAMTPRLYGRVLRVALIGR